MLYSGNDDLAQPRPRALRYVGDEVAVSRYEFHIEGRSVMSVLVDNDDPELVIHISRPGDEDAAQPTKGRAARRTYYGDDGAERTHIDSDSVRRYLNGRVATLLARLYVPPAPVPDEKITEGVVVVDGIETNAAEPQSFDGFEV